MTTPRSIQLSVLPWAPPVVHGLVRDIRVRWALEEAGWPYSEHVVAPDYKTNAGYRTLQPFGQVPALQTDQEKLFESGAIVLHIAEQSPALMPQEPEARTQVTTWAIAALNTLEPYIIVLNFIDMLYQGPKGEEIKGLRTQVSDVVEQHLDAFVSVLGSKDFVLGRFTAADLLIVSVLRILTRTTKLIEARPTLVAYQKRCEARPAFKKALGDHLDNFAKHAPKAS